MLNIDKTTFLSDFVLVLNLNEWLEEGLKPVNVERTRRGKKELDLTIKERLDLISAVLHLQKMEEEKRKEKRQMILFYLRIIGFIAGPVALTWTIIDKIF